jgi:hypothetical protein
LPTGSDTGTPLGPDLTETSGNPAKGLYGCTNCSLSSPVFNQYTAIAFEDFGGRNANGAKLRLFLWQDMLLGAESVLPVEFDWRPKPESVAKILKA